MKSKRTMILVLHVDIYFGTGYGYFKALQKKAVPKQRQILLRLIKR